MKNIRHYTLMFSHKIAEMRMALCISVLAFLIAAALAGCAKKENEVLPIATQPPEIAPGVEVDTPQEGGELRIFVPSSANSLDPLANNVAEVGGMLSLVYEQLIRYDGSLRLSPSLAESWEPIDSGGKEWKVSLRKGATWHGTKEPFTADDVLYTLNLLRQEEYQNSPYSFRINSIESCEAIDEYTLRVAGVEPGTQVIHALTFPVVSRKFFKHGAQPCGTGPYSMIGASPGVGFQFHANESWWRTPPNIKSVIAYCLEDNDAALMGMQDSSLNYVPSRSLTASSFRKEGNVGVLQSLTQQSEVMLINQASVFFRDRLVREALAYAIDRRGISTKAYLGHAFATDVPISPANWLYASEYKKYDYNPDHAKELLKRAGWVDLDNDGIIDMMDSTGRMLSFRVSLLVNDTPENAIRKSVADLIATNLKDVGIDVNINSERWSGENQEYLQKLQTGSFELALAGFNMDPYPDLTPFVGTDGENNYGGFRNAEMDRRLDNFRRASAESEVISAAKAVQDLFVSELPYIHLYFVGSSITYNETLQFTAEAAKNISDISPFFSIEQWYFDVYGRKEFEVTSSKIPVSWNSFDRGEELDAESSEFPEVSGLETPSPEPERTQAPTAERNSNEGVATYRPSTPTPNRNTSTPTSIRDTSTPEPNRTQTQAPVQRQATPDSRAETAGQTINQENAVKTPDPTQEIVEITEQPRAEQPRNDNSSETERSGASQPARNNAPEAQAEEPERTFSLTE